MIQSGSNPYNALKLAKAGNPEAIQIVINHLLKDQDITTTVLLKNDAIYIIIESEEIISQLFSTASIIQILNKINAPYLNTAVIQAKIKGQVNPIWTECIQLNVEAKAEAEITSTEPKKISRFFHWPAWFPYPSSWLRSMILLLWVGIVVRIFGFWGVFFGGVLSLIADDPILFLQMMGISLLASCLVLSYIYHFIDFKNISSWFPPPIKLWEGIYAPIVLIISITIVTLLCVPFIPLNECTLSNASQSLYCRRILNSYYQEINLYANGILIFSILYLYQIEYLLKTYVPFKKILKYTFMGLITIFILVNIQFTVQNWNYIYGAIAALTPPRIEQTNPVHSTVTQAQPAEKSTKTPKIDPFQAAVNQAIIAAELTQSAQSPLEWQQVANYWESALELMKVVPPSHSQYAVAQDRVIQYQKNLDYANTNQIQNHP